MIRRVIRSPLWMMCLVACGFPRPADVGPAGDDAGHDAIAVDATSEDAPPVETIRSCMRGLARTCGVQRNDSCCTSPVVPGDYPSLQYFRSFDAAHDSASGDTNSPATVWDFRLDKYEVTVGRFRAFVDAGAGTQQQPPGAGEGAHAAITGSGWDASWNGFLAVNSAALSARLRCDSTFQTWTDNLGDNEERPINCVSWYEAMAFCAWDGGYLPTEAEWNYAAAGGQEQRAYPWSDPPSSTMVDPTYASYKNGSDCGGDGAIGCGLTDILAVGSRPAGDARWGQSDLGGNMFEMLLDWEAAYPVPCVDCANLTPADIRVFRGGSFMDSASNMRTGFRAFIDSTPGDRASVFGFRCARAP